MELKLNTDTGVPEYVTHEDATGGKKTLVTTAAAQTLSNKTLDGTLMITGLPTEDPLVAGQVWSDEGILTVSAGE